VQFNHRLLGLATVAAALVLWGAARRAPAVPPAARRLAALAAAAAVAQAALGIATLLLVVPIPLAVLHQAGAVLLLTLAVLLRHALRPGPSPVLSLGHREPALA
jgi:cytochrome c oxidase assembly protein subunit 15